MDYTTRLVILVCLLIQGYAHTQPAKQNKELKYNLSPDGTKYVKATFLTQVWLRWNESNPGTTVIPVAACL